MTILIPVTDWNMDSAIGMGNREYNLNLSRWSDSLCIIPKLLWSCWLANSLVFISQQHDFSHVWQPMASRHNCLKALSNQKFELLFSKYFKVMSCLCLTMITTCHMTADMLTVKESGYIIATRASGSWILSSGQLWNEFELIIQTIENKLVSLIHKIGKYYHECWTCQNGGIRHGRIWHRLSHVIITTFIYHWCLKHVAVLVIYLEPIIST